MPPQKPLTRRRKAALKRIFLWCTPDGLPIGYLVRNVWSHHELPSGPFATEEEAIQDALDETQYLSDIAQARKRGVAWK